jgi:hypothetical protein
MDLPIDPFVLTYQVLTEKVHAACRDLHNVVSELSEPVDRLETAKESEIESWLSVLEIFFAQRSKVIYNGDYKTLVWERINSLKEMQFSSETCENWLSSLFLMKWFVQGSQNTLESHLKSEQRTSDYDKEKDLLKELLVSSNRLMELLWRTGMDMNRAYEHKTVYGKALEGFRSKLVFANIEDVMSTVSRRGLIQVGDDYLYAEKLPARNLTNMLKRRSLLGEAERGVFGVQPPEKGIVVTDAIEIDPDQLETNIFYFVSYNDEKYVARKTESGNIEIFEVVE